MKILIFSMDIQDFLNLGRLIRPLAFLQIHQNLL